MLSGNIDWAVADSRQRFGGELIPLTVKKRNMPRNISYLIGMSGELW